MSSLKNSQRPNADSRDLRILKIGPKEQPFGSGYDTSIRRWAMRQTELVSASRVAILENAEAARQLLLGQAASNAPPTASAGASSAECTTSERPAP